MKKFLLLFLLISSFSDAQKRMPVLPECKQELEIEALRSCFLENFNKSLSKMISYMVSSSEYLLIPSQDIQLRIKINKQGEIKLGEQKEEIHPLFLQIIDLYIDQLNTKNLANGGVKPGLDENKKITDIHFKIPIKYIVEYTVDDKFRTYDRVLTLNIDKKANLYQLILHPDFKFSLLKNGEDYKTFNSIREYLDFSDKLILEANYLEKDFNIINVEGNKSIIGNHWLTPSEKTKRIVLRDQESKTEEHYYSIEDFLKSNDTNLMFIIK